jgi:integrase
MTDRPGSVCDVATGVVKVHRKGCKGGRCRCSSFEAWVWDARAGRKLRKTFDSDQAARSWRQRTLVDVQRGAATAGSGVTVRQAGDQLVAGMRAGTVRNRSGRPYKPSVAAGYESSLVERVYSWMGARRLADVDRRHVQALVDELAASRSASTVRNVIMPLRVIFRRALRDGEVVSSPVAGVELPAPDERARDRMATPDESQLLVAAVPAADRAAWALAVYGGLRLGELRALDWRDVDLDAGELHIRQAYCNRTKQITAPKTKAAVRTVPIVGELRRALLEHRLLTGRRDGLVVERAGGGVESGDSLAWRAEKAWKAGGLERVTMHEARHTYASLMILARVPITALSRFMGHTSITVTVDRYGHLYPMERAAAVEAFDALFAAPLADRLADDAREPAQGAE